MAGKSWKKVGNKTEKPTAAGQLQKNYPPQEFCIGIFPDFCQLQ